MHTCDQTCSDCMASPPCVPAGVRISLQTVTDTLGAIRVSTTIRGKTETRRLSASTSEIVDRAADLSYRTVNTNVANDIARRVKRTEK